MIFFNFAKSNYKYLRSSFRKYMKKLKVRRLINSKNGDLRVIIGSGITNYKGWISTDYPYFDITKESDWKFYFKVNKPNFLLAEHVLEHLTVNQINEVFKLAHKYLTCNGCFRMAVPDAYNENLDYIDAVKPGGWDIGADDHKTFMDIDSYSKCADSVGFLVRPLEYYTKDRVFHKNDFDNMDGYIERSMKNDFRDNNVPNFTSLIIDFIKP
jgi:predicted SAM-dependent methyltransferase